MRYVLPVLLFILTLPVPAAAQSWCAAGSLSPAERTICETPVLGELDARMQRLYARDGSGRAGVSLEQREWLTLRDRCGTDTICLRLAYRNRIDALAATRSAADRPGAERPIPDRPSPERPARTRPDPASTPRTAPDDPLRPWCTGAQNPTEREICGAPVLADLDAALAVVYGATKAADSDRAQLTWLREERDGCGRDRGCIRAAYIDRIIELGGRLRLD